MKIKKFQYGGEPAVSTYVYKKPILPRIQRTPQPLLAEFRPDNRSSWEKQQGLARAQLEYARYQKAQQDLKAQEGFDKLMHVTLPSTYIESITGQNFGPVGRFVIDMATPGVIGGANKLLRTAGRGVSKGLKRTLTSIKTEGGFPVSTPYTGKRFGKITAWVPTNRSPFKGISYLSTGKPEPEGVPINYIRSKVSGDARKLYDVGIRQAQESGNKGLVVGRYLESAPKSLRTYDHYYPDRVHLDNGGTYTNYGMVKGPNKTVFSLNDFYKLHNAGNRVSFPGAPRYRLETPSNLGLKVQAISKAIDESVKGGFKPTPVKTDMRPTSMEDLQTNYTGGQLLLESYWLDKELSTGNPEKLIHFDNGDFKPHFWKFNEDGSKVKGAYVKDNKLTPSLGDLWWNEKTPFNQAHFDHKQSSLWGLPKRYITVDKSAGNFQYKNTGFFNELVSEGPVDLSNASVILKDPLGWWGRVKYTPSDNLELYALRSNTGSNSKITAPDVYKSLAEAEKYKGSKGYTELVHKAQKEAEEMGLVFNPDLYIKVNKHLPDVKLNSRPKGNLGGYRRSTNTIELDPDLLNPTEGKYVPFHEGLHWLRVGTPEMNSPLYNRWKEDMLNDLAWKEFYNSEEYKNLAYEDNAKAYARKKVKEALYEDADPYLSTLGELLANGLEAGRAIGLEPFAEYPGYSKAIEAVKKARNYNKWLYDVKAGTILEMLNFWKILTGNYLPAVSIPLIFKYNEKE